MLKSQNKNWFSLGPPVRGAFDKHLATSTSIYNPQEVMVTKVFHHGELVLHSVAEQPTQKLVIHHASLEVS